MRVLALAAAALAWQQVAGPTFRASVERVPIDVSVTRGGRPVGGLTASDFVVTDQGVAQSVESLAMEDVPLSVELVLDTSGSVAGPRLRYLIEACQGLVGALRALDHAGLITLSSVIEVRVPLTPDLASVKRAVVGLTSGGATSLRDAVQLAIELPPAAGTRPVVMVFTDGEDTMSWLTEDAVVESARRAGVVVHLVVQGEVLSTSRLPDRLADATGGRVWSASSSRDLARLFTAALAEMRARYLLTFAPPGQLKPGWHELSVKLRSGRADITARPGYFVDPR